MCKRVIENVFKVTQVLNLNRYSAVHLVRGISHLEKGARMGRVRMVKGKKE